MESWKEYSQKTDEYLIGIKFKSSDAHLAEAHLLRNSIIDAEKLLTKMVLRRFLQKHPIETLVAQININDILARSLKINISMEE